MSESPYNKLAQFARRQPPFWWLVVCAGLITFCHFTLNGVAAYRYSQLDKFGYTVESPQSVIVVSQVDAAGPAQGKLQVGDVVLSLNGPAGEVPVRWKNALVYALYHAPADT